MDAEGKRFDVRADAENVGVAIATKRLKSQ